MEARSHNDILSSVRRIIAETTGTEDAALTARLADLCMDSLEAASVIVDLEDEFSIDIDSSYQLTTVSDVVKFIEAKQ